MSNSSCANSRSVFSLSYLYSPAVGPWFGCFPVPEAHGAWILAAPEFLKFLLCAETKERHEARVLTLNHRNIKCEDEHMNTVIKSWQTRRQHTAEVERCPWHSWYVKVVGKIIQELHQKESNVSKEISVSQIQLNYHGCGFPKHARTRNGGFILSSTVYRWRCSAVPYRGAHSPPPSCPALSGSGPRTARSAPPLPGRAPSASPGGSGHRPAPCP